MDNRRLGLYIQNSLKKLFKNQAFESEKVGDNMKGRRQTLSPTFRHESVGTRARSETGDTETHPPAKSGGKNDISL